MNGFHEKHTLGVDLFPDDGESSENILCGVNRDAFSITIGFPNPIPLQLVAW
jgi:hypothetical protein